jgi:hypothetical protein
MIVGRPKTVPQQALFVKKLNFNKKVSFDVISKDTFLLNFIFFNQKSLQGDGFPSLAYQLS